MNNKINKNQVVARKKQGIWVFRTGGRVTASVVSTTIEKVRDEREQQILGKNWKLRTKAK
jgi:hypothetical protein